MNVDKDTFLKKNLASKVQNRKWLSKNTFILMNAHMDTVEKKSDEVEFIETDSRNSVWKSRDYSEKKLDKHNEIYNFLTSIKPHCKNNLSIRLDETYQQIVDNQMESEKTKSENENWKISSLAMERNICNLEKELRNMKTNTDDLRKQLEISEQLRVKLNEKVNMIKKQADKSLVLLLADNKKIRDENTRIREVNTLMTNQSNL